MNWAFQPITNVTGLVGFEGVRQAIILGLDSAQNEATGWDAEVKVKIPVTDVVRTSDTVVTITLTAEAAYDITAQETITAIVPVAALVSGGPLTATPAFTIDFGAVTSIIPLIMFDQRRRRI